MATEIDRSIPTVNLLQVANPDFGVQDAAVNADKAAAKSKVAQQTALLTVSAQLASEVALAVVDDLPLPKGDGMSTAQLEKLLAKLSMMSREQQYQQGLNAVDNQRVITSAVGLAAAGMIANFLDAVVRGAATDKAAKALFFLASIDGKSADSARSDFYSLDPSDRELLKGYFSSVLNGKVTAAEVAEQVLKRAWDDSKSVYSPELLQSTATEISAKLNTKEQFVDTYTAVEQETVDKAETSLTKAEKEREAALQDKNDAYFKYKEARKPVVAALEDLNKAHAALAAAQDKLHQALAAEQKNVQAGTAAPPDSAYVKELKAEVDRCAQVVVAAQTKFDDLKKVYSSCGKKFTEAVNTSSQKKKEAEAAKLALHKAKYELTKATDEALHVFADTFQGVIDALSDYADEMKKANDAVKKRNVEKDEAVREIRKELLRTMTRQEELADKLAKIMATVADSIVTFQAHLAHVLDETADTERKVHEERRV